MSGMSPERSIKTNAVFIILNNVYTLNNSSCRKAASERIPELTKVSDWGEGTQPQHMQLEV